MQIRKFWYCTATSPDRAFCGNNELMKHEQKGTDVCRVVLDVAVVHERSNKHTL